MKKVFSIFVFMMVFTKSLFCNADMYFGAGIGTTGVNVNIAYYWKNFIGVRGEYNFVPSFITGIADNALKDIERVNYAKTKFNSYGFDVSVRPFFGSWHIDLGFRDMRYLGSIGAVEHVYNTSDAYVSGDIEARIAKGIKPYIGTGWNFNPFLGFNINLNIGLIYTGKWRVNGVITPNYGSLSESQIATFSDEIDDAKNEVESSIDEVNSRVPSFMRVWPVITFGIGWKFDII